MVQLTLPKNSKVSIGKTYKLQKKTSNQKVFKIYRFDPESGNLPSIDKYEVDLDSCGPIWDHPVDSLGKFENFGSPELSRCLGGSTFIKWHHSGLLVTTAKS